MTCQVTLEVDVINVFLSVTSNSLAIHSLASLPMMQPPTFLEELDARQNEVLEQLDDLNRKVEQLVQSWMSGLAQDVPDHENSTLVKPLNS